MKFLREIPTIVMSMALISCASVKRASGPNQLSANGILPPIKTREIQVEVIYNGPDEITPKNLRERIYLHRKQVIATQFRSDLEAIGFKISNQSKTKFKAIVSDYTNLSWWRGALSGLTLTILPQYYSDRIVTEFVIESDNNNITSRTFESSIDIAARNCHLFVCIDKHGFGDPDDPIWPEELSAIKDSISKFADELKSAMQEP